MRKAIGLLLAGMAFLAASAIWGDATSGDVASAADAVPAQRASPDAQHSSLANRNAHDALAAELSGDDARRDALLSQALHEDPACRPARWQAGFVLLDGRWMTPQEAARKYSADRNLAEYVRRRDRAVQAGLFARGAMSTNVNTSDVISARTTQASSIATFRSDVLSPAGIAAEADLARWCRSKRLVDEERAHWTQVLLYDPDNSEAQARLGLRWFKGSLYTNARIDAIKKQIALEEKQRAQWKPSAARWQKALDNGTTSEKFRSTEEMLQIKDSSVIPALESAAWSDAPKPPANRNASSAFQTAAVALLGRLSVQRATYSLTQLSVLGRQADLRSAAAGELRQRKLDDFVPVLLDGLANPIQFRYSISSDSNGLSLYSAALAQETRDKNRQIRIMDSFRPNTIVAFDSGQTTELSNGSLEYRLQENALLADSVRHRNDQIEELDRRINVVMECVTGQHAALPKRYPGDSDVIPDSVLPANVTPTADYWWNWWDNYNEAYDPYKPTEIVEYQYAAFTPTCVHCSCFPAGTLVPTQIGPVAIEKIQIGDRVLAQDVDTGELAYKPVLGTTVRPPAELVEVTTSTGSVRLTRGHAFWIDGKGWRMAKQSHIGDRLHGLRGASTVTAIGNSRPEAVYNLNVADFHTYFVGDGGQILVHDYSPRLPTAATIPGFVPKAP